MAREFLRACEVAQMLGLPSADAFRRKRARLEQDHDFPPPMPHLLRGLLWRRDQIQLWIDRQGAPAPAVPRLENVVPMMRRAGAA